MVADALLVVSALLVAVTVTAPAAEPVNVTVVAAGADSVPGPVVNQVTPRLPLSFATVAVKLNACDTTMPPRTGVRLTATGTTGIAVIVIVIDADLVPSATEVAVTVTVGGFGGAAGAVYVTAAPDALVAGDTTPHVAALQPAPETAQLTPLPAASFATVAITVCVAPA